MRAADLDERVVLKSELGEERIMWFYLNIKPEFGKLFRSPLREDKNPTCSFYYSKKGVLYFHDFSKGESYDIFSVVQKKFNLNFNQALKKIRADSALIKQLSKDEAVPTEKQYTLTIIEGNLALHMSYWNNFKIRKETLELYDVGYAKYVEVDGNLAAKSTPNNPIYFYNSVCGKTKLYRPLSPDKKKKWGGNANEEVVWGKQGLKKKGKILFLTSSLKEVMVLHQMGFSAIAPNSENILSEKFIEEVKNIKRRYEHFVILMDSDDAGRKAASKFLTKFKSGKCLFVRREKDLSDFQKKYGEHRAFREIKRLLSNNFKRKFNVPY